MTDVAVTFNTDEQVKRSFEEFCVRTEMNMSTAFAILVRLGISISEQGLMFNIANEAHNREVSAVKRFLSDINELKDEDNTLTDIDLDELANLRSHTNAGLSRTVKL